MEILAAAIEQSYEAVEKLQPSKALLCLLSSASCAGLYDEFVYEWTGDPSDPRDVPDQPLIMDEGFTVRQYAGFTYEGNLVVVRRRNISRSTCTKSDYLVASANLRKLTISRWHIMREVAISGSEEAYQLGKEECPEPANPPVKIRTGNVFRDLLDTLDINDMHAGDTSAFAHLVLSGSGDRGSSYFIERGVEGKFLAGSLDVLDTQYAKFQRKFGSLLVRPAVSLVEPAIIQG